MNKLLPFIVLIFFLNFSCSDDSVVNESPIDESNSETPNDPGKEVVGLFLTIVKGNGIRDFNQELSSISKSTYSDKNLGLSNKVHS